MKRRQSRQDWKRTISLRHSRQPNDRKTSDRLRLTIVKNFKLVLPQIPDSVSPRVQHHNRHKHFIRDRPNHRRRLLRLLPREPRGHEPSKRGTKNTQEESRARSHKFAKLPFSLEAGDSSLTYKPTPDGTQMRRRTTQGPQLALSSALRRSRRAQRCSLSHIVDSSYRSLRFVDSAQIAT